MKISSPKLREKVLKFIISKISSDDEEPPVTEKVFKKPSDIYQYATYIGMKSQMTKNHVGCISAFPDCEYPVEDIIDSIVKPRTSCQWFKKPTTYQGITDLWDPR